MKQGRCIEDEDGGHSSVVKMLLPVSTPAISVSGNDIRLSDIRYRMLTTGNDCLIINRVL